MAWKRLVEIDNLQKKIDEEKKPKNNKIEKRHRKKPKIEVIHKPDRFDLDIIKIIHR